jgi:hypothetical protein
MYIYVYIYIYEGEGGGGREEGDEWEASWTERNLLIINAVRPVAAKGMDSTKNVPKRVTMKLCRDGDA